MYQSNGKLIIRMYLCMFIIIKNRVLVCEAWMQSDKLRVQKISSSILVML